jgi:molecular chaperone DnaJ
VPPGVLEGHYLTLRGAGNAGLRGGEAGDLRVEIEETPHAHFHREGLDVVHDLFLSVPDALLGTEADVPTLEGTATLKIEPGTPGGKVLRLRGRGLPELGGRGHGDELVRVNVWMPPRLTPEEQTLVERLRAAPSFQERPQGPGGNGKSIFARFKDAFSG